MPTLPVPPKVTAGVKKVGGTDWKGGWHRLERWVAPIGKVGGTNWKGDPWLKLNPHETGLTLRFQDL
jgi:hypothetical protein